MSATTIPWKVGISIQDAFDLVNVTTGAGVTGKVQADFTINVSRGTTGNIATTGITITEVDAVNNPGHYAVVISGVTGFVASTTGEYLLEIYLTSDPYSYRWDQLYYVSNDGTMAGTIGAARFVPTAADGRITDGTSALSGVTIRLLNPSNVVMYQTLSDANGLWPAVYSDTTLTIEAQRSGYTLSNSGTITVAGSTATGPGTDIELTGATSASGVSFAELVAYARRMARNSSGSLADTQLGSAVNDALGMIATSKQWERYKQDGMWSIHGQYTTGTITTTKGDATVTLATGTWPSWAALGKLRIKSKVYRIASRTSDTEVELIEPWNQDALSGETYVIFQDEYALPSDLFMFGRLLPGENWAYGGEPVGVEQLFEAMSYFPYGFRYPNMWAIHGRNSSMKLMMYPFPNIDTNCAYWYYRKPAVLVNGTDVADISIVHLELLHRAIDYQVALYYEGCVAGTPAECYSRYTEAYARASQNDQTATHPGRPTSRSRNGPFVQLRMGT